MRSCRREVGNRLDKFYDRNSKAFRRVHYYEVVKDEETGEHSQSAMNDHGTILHFFVEVGEIHQQGYLDEKLFYSLFRDSLPKWSERVANVYYDTETYSELEEHDLMASDMKVALQRLAAPPAPKPLATRLWRLMTAP